jgi:hypothetical protein
MAGNFTPIRQQESIETWAQMELTIIYYLRENQKQI